MLRDLTAVRVGALATLAASLTAALIPASGDAESPTRLRERAEQLRAERSAIAGRSRSALLELYSLTAAVARTHTDVTGLEADAAAVARARSAVKRDVARAKRTLALAEERLAARMRAVYEHSASEPLAIVLGSQSLDDALAAVEALGAAADADRRLVNDVRTERTRLAAFERSLAARERRLARLLESARAAAAALERARSERRAFITQLARQRRLTAGQIAALESRARAIDAKANALAAQRQTEPAPSAATHSPVARPPAAGGRTLTVVATGYALRGRTATGAQTGPGIVAVDPSVIPLGTRLTIPGYGTGIAADTGPAVRGATIDLWFPTVAAATAWGKRTVTITLH